MAATLTVKAVEALKPGAARREVPDGLVPGLRLIVQPSGARSWALRYRTAGRPAKVTLGGFPAVTLQDARDLARRALADVARGVDPGAAKKAARAAAAAKPEAPPADLIERVVDQFMARPARANTKAETATENRRLLDRNVVAAWAGRRLSEITRADVHELLDGIVDRGSPVAANRVLAALRKLCNWSVDRGIIAASPCEKIAPPTAEKSRDRVLGDAELARVWAAAGALGWPFGPLIRLLMVTAQRRDEVGHMAWREVDLDAALWVLPRERAKNDASHVVPLSPAALAILRGLPRMSGSGFAFSTTGATPVSGHSRAKSRLDALLAADGGPPLAPWRVHDLRRSVATGMARLGVALPTIEKVLNHTSGSFGGIVGVYQRHDFADEKKIALDLWSAHVERLIGGNIVPLRAAEDAA